MWMKLRHAAALLLASCSLIVPSAWSQPSLEDIKIDYQTVSTKLKKHLVDEAWIDDDPESANLLAQQWSLAGDWVAAWLNAHPHSGAAGVRAAILELAPSSTPQYLVLNDTTFLVVSPGLVGNVFIVSKSGGNYRLAWSTEQPQDASGKSAALLVAWRAKNARYGDWTTSGSAGSIVNVRLGILPSDAKGRPRFYIEGTYAQEAGGTVAEQISLWVWDGVTARPQLSRYFLVMLDQKVKTRMEGDFLKVQQKKDFRTFFPCGECEGRQTDWIVRITPENITEVGEKSLVPELDAVDELFYRVINSKSAADIAAPAVIKAARGITNAERSDEPDKEWKQFPELGMIDEWSVSRMKDREVLCLGIDGVTNMYKLKRTDDSFYITDITRNCDSCSK
jgi:hypothetical protein